MSEIEAILILLVAVAMLATLANRIGVPYPILLVLSGLVLGFVKFLPQVELGPEVVFLLFLPPLLYVSAIFTSWRDFRANLRSISLLAVWLVLLTTCAVAAAAHWVIGFSWTAAFVLGAIVSPIYYIIGASTKSGKGRRVRLTQRAVMSLKDHHKRQLEERMCLECVMNLGENRIGMRIIRLARAAAVRRFRHS